MPEIAVPEIPVDEEERPLPPPEPLARNALVDGPILTLNVDEAHGFLADKPFAALVTAGARMYRKCRMPIRLVTHTPLLEGRLAQIPNGDEVLRAYAERHPLGRVLTPRDIASAIAYIASPVASGITGVALPVDAGIGATWDNFRDPPWIRNQSSAESPPSTR